MERNLYNILSGNTDIVLDDKQRLSLASFLGKGCREKTKKRLKSMCLYGLGTIYLCGILRRVDLEEDSTWSYCAGQSYTAEMLTVRNVILGRR